MLKNLAVAGAVTAVVVIVTSSLPAGAQWPTPAANPVLSPPTTGLRSIAINPGKTIPQALAEAGVLAGEVDRMMTAARLYLKEHEIALTNSLRLRTGGDGIEGVDFFSPVGVALVLERKADGRFAAPGERVRPLAGKPSQPSAATLEHENRTCRIWLAETLTERGYKVARTNALLMSAKVVRADYVEVEWRVWADFEIADMSGTFEDTCRLTRRDPGVAPEAAKPAAPGSPPGSRPVRSEDAWKNLNRP